MAFSQFSTFNEFWDAISHQVKHGNRPSYHPCCRVWVSRKNKTCRASHLSTQLWRDVLLSLGSEDTDHKVLLHAHMLEHQWGLPIRLNAPCNSQVSQAALNQALRNPENPPPPQPSPGHFCFHAQQPVPSSPRSSPAQLQEQPLDLRPLTPRPQAPPQPQIETESRLPNPR